MEKIDFNEKYVAWLIWRTNWNYVFGHVWTSALSFYPWRWKKIPFILQFFSCFWPIFAPFEMLFLANIEKDFQEKLHIIIFIAFLKVALGSK